MLFTKLVALWARLENEEDGATMVEYGLIVTLVALAAVVGATAMGVSLDALFNDIANRL